MKYLLGSLIILGGLCLALVACQNAAKRGISSKHVKLEHSAYLNIKSEINTLLNKTSNLKRFKVEKPRVF